MQTQFKVNMDTQQNEILSSDTSYKQKLITDVQKVKSIANEWLWGTVLNKLL